MNLVHRDSSRLAVIGLLLCFVASAWSAEIAPEATPAISTNETALWRNPDKPIAERVQALMAQLTQKEKISLLYWLAPAIERLGIPAYHHGNESLHGLVRPGKFTVFPQAIGLGATFDPELVHLMSTAISDEARAKWNETGGKHLGTYSDVLTLWSPVVNMARDPRWGRTQETYGEDPWLTSRIGVAFVRGLQGDDPHYLKVIATPKHFAGNNEEKGRFGKNIICDERYLHEFELFPFQACIEEGKAESIMAAYTAINGVPCSANKWLLTDVLRKQWGFQGYVVSDCGAVSNVVDAHHYATTPEEAIADCLNAGLDVEGGYFAKYPDVVNNYLPLALEKGLLKQEVVDHALSLVLTGRFKLGMYDPASMVPYSKIPSSVIGSEEHLGLARKLADESLVLLKNEAQGGNPLLPIDPAKSGKIFVVGPNANVMQFGDYSGTPTATVTPFEGIKERAEKAGLTATLLPWAGSILEVVPSDSLKPTASDADKSVGLSAEYFSSENLTGQPKAKRIDQKLNFDWAHIEPDPLASDAKFSVRWTGNLIANTPGTYSFSIKADGGYRLFIDGKNIIDQWNRTKNTRQVKTAKVDGLEAGKHALRIEYRHHGGETGFVWSWSQPVQEDFYGQLKSADLVIAVMGLSTDYEIEGKDRTTLVLPPDQEEFLHKVIAVNPRTVAVFESGSSLAMPWAATKMPAIVQAWYPGQEGGRAIADVLFGDVNPSGRLPLTFYSSDEQLRPMSEYDITKGRTYMYLPQKPLYPFGYGLSYTSFQYSELKLSKATASLKEHVTVSVNVTNTGACDGDEIVQCYVHALQSSVPMPIKQLWGFQRVTVPKGTTRTVTLDLDTQNFGHWDEKRQSFVVEPGKFDIMVGATSDDIRAKTSLELVP